MYGQCTECFYNVENRIMNNTGGGATGVPTGSQYQYPFAIFLKKIPFLLQCFGEKNVVFLATFAQMYPFVTKIDEKWRAAPKMFKNCPGVR